MTDLLRLQLAALIITILAYLAAVLMAITNHAMLIDGMKVLTGAIIFDFIIVIASLTIKR